MAGTGNEVDKVDVNGDSRVSRKIAFINGKIYGIVALVCVHAHDVGLTVSTQDT